MKSEKYYFKNYFDSMCIKLKMSERLHQVVRGMNCCLSKLPIDVKLWLYCFSKTSQRREIFDYRTPDVSSRLCDINFRDVCS